MMEVTALTEGIQKVGTGKLSKKSCDADLAQRIYDQLKSEATSPVARAAFFAALFVKGPTDEEKVLTQYFAPGVFEDPEQLVRALCNDLEPKELEERWLKLATDILRSRILTYDEAYKVGRFFFSQEPGDSLRALMTSVLRMRHTEAEEYFGILTAMHETISPAFRMPVPEGAPIVQIAEPFDGTDRSYFLTPILGEFFRKKGFRVLHLIGDCAGPKYGVTIKQVASSLKLQRLKSHDQLGEETPWCGWTVDQADLSPAVQRWVDIRKQTIKRPYLATLEKYLNPWRADVFIASAFHAGFSEKMVETAELQGYRLIIVTFKGIEGSLGPSLGRGTQIVISRRNSSGQYERITRDYRPAEFGFPAMADPELEPTVERTAELNRRYLTEGTSGDNYFDLRAKWIETIYEQIFKDFLDSAKSE